MDNKDMKRRARSKSPQIPGLRSPSPNLPLPMKIAMERFRITPQTMGLEKRAHTPSTQQNNEQATSQIERQFNKQSMASIPGMNNESQTQPQSSLQAKPTNLNTPLQQSPPPALESPQSNFDNAIKFQNSPQQNPYTSSSPKYDNSQESNYYLYNYVPRRSNSDQPISSNVKYPVSSNLKSSEETNALPLSPSVDNSQCFHHSHHSSLQNITSELPTAYFAQHCQKYRSGSEQSVSNTAEMNGCLNDIFVKRLQDIDANAGGDHELKLITYQEWVDMLLKVNNFMITNMEELETEVAERLEMVQRKVNTNCRHSQGNELMKCKKDINTLLQFIQNAYKYNNWDLQDLNLETVTTAAVLELTQQKVEMMKAEGGGNGAQPRISADAEAMYKNKFSANTRALVFEVAEKHDEIRELKRQVLCMEDEIQKAQKKIQFKEDVIKDLKKDLKCANNKLQHRGSLESNSGMPPINFEQQTSRSTNTDLSDNTLTDEIGSQYDSLCYTEQEESQMIKDLSTELKELFITSNECNNTLNQRLTEILKKWKSKEAASNRRLDFIRRALINLESSSPEHVNDCDSGFHSKCEKNNDVKIIDSVRKRFYGLNETIVELKKKLHNLEMENRDLSTNLQSETNISKRNSQILKEIADLLCGMQGQQFSYTDIYNQSEVNPFCEAIMKMQSEFKEREIKLMHSVEMRKKQITDLSESLINNDRLFAEQQRAQENIIDLENLQKSTLPPTTPPPPIPTPSTSSAATLLSGQEPDDTTSQQCLKEIDI